MEADCHARYGFVIPRKSPKKICPVLRCADGVILDILVSEKKEDKPPTAIIQPPVEEVKENAQVILDGSSKSFCILVVF